MSKNGPGYYPGYHTLEQRKFWDATTRELVVHRVTKVPEIRFFQPEEARLMEAVCGRVLPQDDREEAYRIPIVPWIDDRLYSNRHDGYRFEDMPPDREAYQLGLKAINEIALHLHRRQFCDLTPLEQDEILETLHDGNPPAAQEIWNRMPVHGFWMLLVTDCVRVYYAHPWAWDEIGYGGPAYPRAYMRLERGEPEPWDRPEKRYAWDSPGASPSEKFTPVAGEAEHHGSPKGGTH